MRLSAVPSFQVVAAQSSGQLRAWQREAFGVYLEAVDREERSILWEATPGAGKTTAALVVCRHQLKQLAASGITVVVPTAHLKTQWARSALKMDLQLDSAFSNSRSRGILAKDYDGIVVTYQQIAQQPLLFRKLTKNGVVILDEAHHAGDGLSWGDSLRAALGNAKFILCLSGTPFRSDDNPIPFVNYDADGFSLPDYSYGYSRAVEEGVCRPTAFFTYGGDIAWRERVGDVAVSFSDSLDALASSRRLRAALDAQSGWINQMLLDAHQMLLRTRLEQSDAGALLVAADQVSARKLARLLQSLTGTAPTLVLSEEAEAAKRLKNFRDSDSAWLVACNMVSEGVDIPRLRVGVYATTVRTKMYFRQFLGRIVRRMPSLPSLQVAYCYLPADSTLTKLAEEIEKEIHHCIKPQNQDAFSFDEREDRRRDEPAAPTWEVLQSRNSGLDSVIVHGNQLSLFAPTAISTESVQKVVDEKISARLSEKRSRAEEKAALILDLRRLVHRYHGLSGLSHAQINMQLNKAQSVSGQSVCTEKQLRERILMLKKLILGT